MLVFSRPPQHIILCLQTEHGSHLTFPPGRISLNLFQDVLRERGRDQPYGLWSGGI